MILRKLLSCIGHKLFALYPLERSTRLLVEIQTSSMVLMLLKNLWSSANKKINIPSVDGKLSLRISNRCPIWELYRTIDKTNSHEVLYLTIYRILICNYWSQSNVVLIIPSDLNFEMKVMIERIKAFTKVNVHYQLQSNEFNMYRDRVAHQISSWHNTKCCLFETSRQI